MSQVLGTRMYYRRETCRICGSRQLRVFLSLGSMPLANAFLSSSDEFAAELRFPLDVYFCESCSLVQLLDVVDPEVLFRNYLYVTGTSDTIAVHNADYARTLVGLLNLRDSDLVVEVGSNDGSLLRYFQSYGVRIQGIEPATNIAEIARICGIETMNAFFNSSVARLVLSSCGPAKVVIANNVLAHVDDSRDFLLGCKELLDEDGLLVIEVPYLSDLLDHLEYDTIYHEHLCYFSLNTLMRLCEAVGLVIVRMDRVPVHGGSLRIYAGLRKRHGGHALSVRAWARSEQSAGLLDFARFERFAADVKSNRLALVHLLEGLKIKGKTTAGYGAPAKGNTLLNYCGIDTQTISYTVDKNPLKVGLYTPGMHIPVLPISSLQDRMPDYVLILSWNFADEIIRQQQPYLDGGGQFIIPIPEPKVL